jgi:hypothetical protein
MGKRKQIIAGLLMLGASIAVVIGAGAGSAANNTLTVDLTADPGPAAVTFGGNVAFTLVIDSAGNNPWHNVLVTVPAPSTGNSQASKGILKYKICPEGTTDLSGPINESSNVVCNLGTVEADETPTLFFVYAMPSVGTDCLPTAAACVKVDVSVTGQEGTVAPDSPKSKGKQDNFADVVEITLLDTFGSDTRRAATYALSACDDPDNPTLVTNEVLGAANPTQTQVCIPSVPGLTLDPGHAIVLNERDRGPSDVGGRSPQISDICIPALDDACDGSHTPFSFDDPDTLDVEMATFTFVVRNKSITGKIENVYENGALVSFDPEEDPHVVSITPDPPSGTTTIVVESSDNGGWDFG